MGKPWGGGYVKRGLPIGNLTSQLFANVYLDELDQFVKHKLKIKYYIRYTDDFVFVDNKKEALAEMVPKLEAFLHERLQMTLHPKKIILRKISQGIDFLGYVILPHHRIIRTKTKRRMFRKMRERRIKYEHSLISRQSLRQTAYSYFGMLKHGRNKGVKDEFKKLITSDRLY